MGWKTHIAVAGLSLAAGFALARVLDYGSVGPGELSSSPWRGNQRSRVVHRPGCRHYNVDVLQVAFASVDAAEKAGYRPCTLCLESG